MSYDHWKTTEPEPYEEEERPALCTCQLSPVHPTDIDPPERMLNRDCPIHGIDPDDAYYDPYWREREWEETHRE